MDRNELAKKAFSQGAAFARKNGNAGLLVPPHMAGKGGPEGGLPRVAVAVCTGDTINSNTAIALGAMQYMMGHLKMPFFLFNFKDDHGATMRNAAINVAMNHECPWLFLVGQNLTFPPNVLPRLLNLALEHKIDVIGVASANRRVPHGNTAIQKPNATEVQSAGTAVEVGGMKPSCLLIHLPTALEKLKRPYFRNPSIEEGEPIPEEYSGVLPPGAVPCIIDDTVYFCLAAQRAGCRVMMDTALSIEVVNWGEAGFKLTGSDEPDAPQFKMVELGQAPTKMAPTEPPGPDQTIVVPK